MPGYEEHLVADFKTGKFLSKEPWLGPADAFPTLVNAYVDKGVLKKRKGVDTFMDVHASESDDIVGMGSVVTKGYHELIVATETRIAQIHKNKTATYLFKPTGGSALSGGEHDYFWYQQFYGSLYFCNSVNPIIKYTPPGTTADWMDTGDVTIQTCQLLLQYKNRLLVIGPTIGDAYYHNYLYYTDVNDDNIKATNFVKAQTDAAAVTGGYIGETPVVFMSDGTIYHIEYTQNSDAPFTWLRKQPADFAAAARMGIAPFKQGLAVMGQTSLFRYDGYECKEFDVPIRGIMDEMDADNINNCYMHRFKDRNFIAIAYTSSGGSHHDRMLLYNLDEANFSTNDIAANCLHSIAGPWSNFLQTPGDYPYPPADGDYEQYELFGTTAGKIYQMNSGYDDADQETNITTDIRSIWMNPYSQEGKKCKLGWIKFLMHGGSGSGFQISLYKDHREEAFKTIQVDCKGSIKNWEQVYIGGEVGSFFRIKIVNTYETYITGSDFGIHAMLFAFKRAGRIGERTQYVSELPG